MIDKLLKQPTDDVWIQLFRYFFVGGTAFAVDFGLLWVLTECAGLHYLLSAALSFAAGLTVNYLLSVWWVFNDHVLRSRILEFAIYVAIGVIGLCFNEAIIWWATEKMNFYYLSSKIVATAMVFFWNFMARKYLLFDGKSYR